jgi:hypothetical protein
MPRWRVDYLGKKASHLGTVEATTEREAIEKAAEQFHITPARRFKRWSSWKTGRLANKEPRLTSPASRGPEASTTGGSGILGATRLGEIARTADWAS